MARSRPVADRPRAADLAARRASRRPTLRGSCRQVAEQTVAAIIAEVPGYAGALSGQMGETSSAVQWRWAGFLELAAAAAAPTRARRSAPAAGGRLRAGPRRGPQRPLDGRPARRLPGRRPGRLAGAVRGGRRRPASTAATMAQFAELVFAYIDELSAASVAGHTDELADHRPGPRALPGAARPAAARRRAARTCSAAAAERADWPPPRTLTAVLLPGGAGAAVLGSLDAGAPCSAGEDVPGLRTTARTPRAAGARRRRRAGGGSCCGSSPDGRRVVGPARPGRRCARPTTAGARGRCSARRAADARWTPRTPGRPRASPPTRRRSPTCAPGPSRRWRTAAGDRARSWRRRCASWLLHHGRREEVAAALFVHPQTVRYRMGQLRELYGDRLDDPARSSS